MTEVPGTRNPLRLRGLDYPARRSCPRRVPSEPRFGVVSPADIHPAVTVRGRDEIIQGFRSQDLRLVLDGHFIEFTIADSSDGLFPFAHPVLLSSTSVREYLPWPGDVQGLDFLRAVAVAADRQWMDRMLVLVDGPEAREVARGYGGQFAMLWDPSGVSVLDLGTGEQLPRFQVRGARLEHRPCPLIPDAVAGDRCKMYGGPWLNQSMVASGYWMDRRFQYEQDLGCDEQCASPSIRRRTALPTRYYTWMWQSEIDQRWQDLVQFVRST